MKKYLIVGLGNVGLSYENTRHNIGFSILEKLVSNENSLFKTHKFGEIATFIFKGRKFILLKPSTYVNLSGKAVKYWMDKEKIAMENLLIISDDLNLEFGTFRLKIKGSDGGHNGLKDINDKLKTQNYSRFRFGISSNFSKGEKSNYVLDKWSEEEIKHLPILLSKGAELVKSFGTLGIENTMNMFNGSF